MRKIQTLIPCHIKAGIEDVNKATNKETYQSFGSLLSRLADLVEKDVSRSDAF